MSGAFNNQMKGATLTGAQGFGGGSMPFQGTMPIGSNFRIYNVGDDLATDFERLNISWIANVATIQAQKGGTGVLRNLAYNAVAHVFQTNGVTAFQTKNVGGISAIVANGPPTGPNYTVATLPPAANWLYGRAFVTDATAPTFGAIVAGGGAVLTPVYCDGVNWLVG